MREKREKRKLRGIKNCEFVKCKKRLWMRWRKKVVHGYRRDAWEKQCRIHGRMRPVNVLGGRFGIDVEF